MLSLVLSVWSFLEPFWSSFEEYQRFKVRIRKTAPFISILFKKWNLVISYLFLLFLNIFLYNSNSNKQFQRVGATCGGTHLASWWRHSRLYQTILGVVITFSFGVWERQNHWMNIACSACVLYSGLQTWSRGIFMCCVLVLGNAGFENTCSVAACLWSNNVTRQKRLRGRLTPARRGLPRRLLSAVIKLFWVSSSNSKLLGFLFTLRQR